MQPGDVYAAVGGEPYFRGLVDRFYAGVVDDPVLRPMYPDDLAASRDHLALFLMQYWGGPATYSAQRGHPRLRARHAPFRIDRAARDAWVGHMEAALASADVPADALTLLRDYFAQAATFMMNTDEAGPPTRVRLRE